MLMRLFVCICLILYRIDGQGDWVKVFKVDPHIHPHTVPPLLIRNPIPVAQVVPSQNRTHQNRRKRLKEMTEKIDQVNNHIHQTIRHLDQLIEDHRLKTQS
ncbi:V4 [Paper mulberry leaf curling associated virus 1]|uniref:V4 n=1 Tax=Paper mulberry leaf curling associated virus 1 TaxID=2738469 RepID=A0A6M6DM80_9GEMI|nr:V4 [Paper mulberry leaf curling associated virus 1]QJX74413.1 V4 [Paper mulberry leaf curling associated virus 1]